MRKFYNPGSPQDVFLDQDGNVCIGNVEKKFFDPVSRTEKVGYIPVKEQIINFLIAGEKMIASRREMYFQSDIEKPTADGDLPLPITRQSGFSITDAYRAYKSYNNKRLEHNRLINERRLQIEKERELTRQAYEQKQSNTTQSETN